MTDDDKLLLRIARLENLMYLVLPKSGLDPKMFLPELDPSICPIDIDLKPEDK